MNCTFWLIVSLVAVNCPGFAEVVLPPVISSHMVLQRDIPAPIWGKAAPDEKVTVELVSSTGQGQAIQKKEVVSDAQGKWKVTLDPMQACAEPRTMIISDGNDKKEITDVLVGEVWVGSGQSNMAGGGGGYEKGDSVLAANIAAGPYPHLRLIKPDKPWMEATPDNIRAFSALLFSFGLPVHKELKVPMGLMVGAVGGTPSGYWLSQEAYESDTACKAMVEEYAKTYNYEEAVKKHEANLEKWKKEVEEAKAVTNSVQKIPKQPEKPLKAGECRNKVGHLYEKNIRPYIPYAIRGVLWDQGESGTAIQGVDQYTLMGALIKGWRNEWGQPPAQNSGAPGRDFAFIYVQKPSGGGCAWDYADAVTCKADKFEKLPASVPMDGEYRENHVRIMRYPNTFMATSSDLGPGVHPVNKSGYGARSARVALGGVYGKPVEIYGPVYKSHKIDGKKVVISFDHVGKGLVFKNGDQLQGFAVSGEDVSSSKSPAGAKGKFVWADAVIDGNTVVVSSETVTNPVAVRYAWAGQHKWANLFNKDGLPALPFRTDAAAK
jgi:sialate O-acetylesterase